MLRRLLPERIDNTFRGLLPALWLFVPLVVLNLLIGFNSMVWPARIASTADGIPLASYDPAGAQAAIGLFALLGVAGFLLALQGVVVLVRYRALVPAMYLLMFADRLGGKIVLFFHPIVRSDAAGFGSPIGVILLAAPFVGLVLSLIGPGWRNADRPMSTRHA